MQTDREFAGKVAAVIQDAIANEKIGFDPNGDAVVTETAAYDEHYLSIDKGVFVRVRLGDGEAEIGIKVQAYTDPLFQEELEQQEEADDYVG